MDIKILAVCLLVGHLISAVFICLVLVRQAKLFRSKVEPGLEMIRRVLFVLALGIFFGNFIPILIDGLTIVGSITRSTNRVNVVGIGYSVSNSLVFALSALLIWIMYQMAARMVLIVEHDKDVALQTKNDPAIGVQ